MKHVIVKLEHSLGFVIEDLGTQDLDGRQAVGFRAKHAKVEIVIWADAETGLPMRIEQNEGQLRVICKNVEFDVPMEETLFSMEVPEGSRNLTPTLVVISFASGGITFMAIDILLDSLQSPAGQLAAMLSDFIPEAMALGATFAFGSSAGGFLLAGLMAPQNVPEGFNAYRELTVSSKLSGPRAIAAFSVMALLGPAAGLSGFLLGLAGQMTITG